MMVFRIAVAVVIVSTLAASAARGAEHDFKVIDGFLLQPLVLPTDDVAVISGEDDRAIYYIDLRLLPREPARLEARTPVSVIGYEGQRPNQIAAHMVNLRQTAAVQPPVEPRRPVDLRMIEGQVQSVTRQALKLRTSDGRTLTVRIGALISSWHAFVKGETLKVFGVLDGSETLAANAVVHYTPRVAPPPSDAPAGSSR
jgi:hypothetical protein